MTTENESPVDAMVELEGQAISLADLAGMDVTDVAEKRFSALPAGLYVLEVMSDPMPHLEAVASGETKKPAAIVHFSVIDCLSIKNPAEVPDGILSLIGKQHRETFFITNADSFGYLKAFVSDIGVDNSGIPGGIPGKTGFLERMAGARFQAPITHRTDKNDSDKVYVNITRDKRKILVLPRATASTVASEVAQAA